MDQGKLDLRILLNDKHPFATLHDATIHALAIDYEQRTLRLKCTLFVGNPDAVSSAEREATADAVLLFEGLLYCVIEPPTSNSDFETGGLQISSHGNVRTTHFNTSLPALPEVPADVAFVHWFFVTNWNASVFVAATQAQLLWREGECM